MSTHTIGGDVLWVLLCGFLVVLMQAGFACLESGMVRAKNSINVAIKNLVDFCISGAVFVLFGFALMFGDSWHGLIGTSNFLLETHSDPWLFAFFFFQVVFCGTAVTIVSGAVAERMRFAGYCLTALLISGFLYPITGHWAWGGADQGVATGWLGQMGFIDFAGSTVVHSVGGWVALAALLVIGPRLGRFGPNGRPIEGSSLPMATLGVFLLWFGWFGFNGGSTLGITTDIPSIIVNTALAGATGGLAAMATGWAISGLPQADRIMNGVLAGLVAITAPCHLVSPVSALMIGAVGGVIGVMGGIWLERLRIDDAIGAVPVHLFAGIWGTLAVALYAPDQSWGEGISRGHQLMVQCIGIFAIGFYTFVVSLISLWLVNLVIPLRVSPRHERIGLNVAEHGATTALLDLLTQMDTQAQQGDFSRKVKVEPETEASQIAIFYNTVLEKFHLETERRHQALQELTFLANYDALTGLANRRHFFETVKRAAGQATRQQTTGAMLYFDLDGFKAVNDTLGHEAGDQLLQKVATRMEGCVHDSGTLARLGGDEFGLLIEDLTQPEQVETMADKILDALAAPFKLGEHTAQIGVSIGVTLFGPERDTPKAIVRRADQAMYAAKLNGKGRWHMHAGDWESLSPQEA